MVRTRKNRKMRTRIKKRGGMRAFSRAFAGARSLRNRFRGTRVAPSPVPTPSSPPHSPPHSPPRSPPHSPPSSPSSSEEYKTDDTDDEDSPPVTVPVSSTTSAANNHSQVEYLYASYYFIEAYKLLLDRFKPYISMFYTKEYIIQLLNNYTDITIEIEKLIDICISGQSIDDDVIEKIYDIPNNMKRATIELNALIIMFDTLKSIDDEKIKEEFVMETYNRNLMDIIRTVLDDFETLSNSVTLPDFNQILTKIVKMPISDKLRGVIEYLFGTKGTKQYTRIYQIYGISTFVNKNIELTKIAIKELNYLLTLYPVILDTAPARPAPAPEPARPTRRQGQSVQEILHLTVLEMGHKTHYTLDEIKKKYHTLAKKKHPNKASNKKTATDDMRKLNEAYTFFRENYNKIFN